MGFRVCNLVNFLPACVKDGKLYCDGMLNRPIQLPKGIPDFPLQLNQVSKPGIACYLRNGDGMELVLRFTKDGCLVQNKYLRSSFILDDWPVLSLYSANVVAFATHADGSTRPVRHLKLKQGVDIISCSAMPVTVLMDDYENSFLNACNKKGILTVVYLRHKDNYLVYRDTERLLEGVQYHASGMCTIGGYGYVKD